MNQENKVVITKLPSWDNATVTLTTECGMSYIVTPLHMYEAIDSFMDRADKDEIDTTTEEAVGAAFISNLALHMISEEDRKAWQAKTPEEKEAFFQNAPKIIEQAKKAIEDGTAIYE